MLAPGSRYSIVAIIDHPVDFDHKKASLPKVAYNYVIKKYVSKKVFFGTGMRGGKKIRGNKQSKCGRADNTGNCGGKCKLSMKTRRIEGREIRE